MFDAFVQLVSDGYDGYMAREALAPAGTEAPSHKVSSLWAYGFKSPDIKSPLRMVLPMGSRVSGVMEGAFLNLSAGLFMPRQQVAPLAAMEPDFVTVAGKFIGTPYRWGGKTALGLDCSGLVQVAMQAAGFEPPRDSDMQQAELGEPLDPELRSGFKRGDHVFWRGHCGIMHDAVQLLHANAHHMAVVVEPLDAVIARAEEKGSRITAIRRSQMPAQSLV